MGFKVLAAQFDRVNADVQRDEGRLILVEIHAMQKPFAVSLDKPHSQHSGLLFPSKKPENPSIPRLRLYACFSPEGCSICTTRDAISSGLFLYPPRCQWCTIPIIPLTTNTRISLPFSMASVRIQCRTS